MRNYITVGTVIDFAGEGSVGAFMGSSTGSQATTITGTGYSAHYTFGGLPSVFGPAFGKFQQSYSQALPADQFNAGWNEGQIDLAQDYYNATGIGVGQIDVVQPGNWAGQYLFGNVTQTATVGIGDGSSSTWCSASSYCSSHPSGALYYNAAALNGAQITGYITTTSGVSTLTVSTMTRGALEPGLVLSGVGITGSPTLTACTTSCPYTTNGAGSGTAWTLSTNQGTVGSSGSPCHALRGTAGRRAPRPNHGSATSPIRCSMAGFLTVSRR